MQPCLRSRARFRTLWRVLEGLFLLGVVLNFTEHLVGVGFGHILLIHHLLQHLQSEELVRAGLLGRRDGEVIDRIVGDLEERLGGALDATARHVIEHHLNDAPVYRREHCHQLRDRVTRVAAAATQLLRRPRRLGRGAKVASQEVALHV